MAESKEQVSTSKIKASKKDIVPEKKKEPLIYIGPSAIQLNRYTVIESDFPVHIKDLINKCPTIEKLFVPVTQFTEIEKKTAKKGTLEHRHYQKIVDFLSGKDDK